MSKDFHAKIALVGPIAPYRGGISQYTTQLNQALKKQADLQTISFKRQYPKFLYPGTGEVSIKSDSKLEPGVGYSLDIYSPLTWRKAADKIAKDGCDLAVLEWWTLIWQPPFAYIARRLRKHGVKVAFLCHNMFDHDATGVKRRLAEKLLSQADAYITHSKEEASMLHDLYPHSPILQRLHPIYDQFTELAQRLPKRGKIELLFFGYIRPYKGLDLLIEAMSKLKDPEVYLTVVGETWDDKKTLEQKLNNAKIPNLELHLEYASDQDTAKYFDRADAVVLPYLSATGSGVVALAYNYGKPVVATGVGGLGDAVLEGETGWLVEPNSPKALAECIGKINRHQTQSMKSAISKFCKQNNWEGMARAITDLAQALKDNGRNG